MKTPISLPPTFTTLDIINAEESQPHGLRRSTMMLKIYTLSHLILFSIFGTAIRLVLESLAFYPRAPVAISVLWAKSAGSLVIGFLNEDLSLFRSHTGRETSIERPAESEAVHKADAAKCNKIIPLYLGLTTGFCGCLTSFSAFLHEVFLVISNDIPSAHSDSLGRSVYMLPSAANQAPSAGHTFLGVIGTVLLEIGFSLIELFLGAHMAIFAAPWIPNLSLWTTERILDHFVIVLVPVLWFATIVFAMSTTFSVRPSHLERENLARTSVIFSLSVTSRLSTQVLFSITL